MSAEPDRPRFRGQLHFFNQGQLFERLGRYRAAEDCYEKAGAEKSAAAMREKIRQRIRDDLTVQLVGVIFDEDWEA